MGFLIGGIVGMYMVHEEEGGGGRGEGGKEQARMVRTEFRTRILNGFPMSVCGECALCVLCVCWIGVCRVEDWEPRWEN